jgi:hypothetical protein
MALVALSFRDQSEVLRATRKDMVVRDLANDVGLFVGRLAR